MTLLLFLLLVLLFANSGFAHEDKDVVCGMVVPIEGAPARSDFAGKTYHFCGASCRDQFLADPARFVATLAVQKISGDLSLSIVVTPAPARAGDVVRIALAADVEVEAPFARLYFVDRDAGPEPLEASFHRLADGTLALQRMLDHAGEWRVVVEARSEGEPLRAIFALPVVARSAREGGSSPIADGLSMAEQHESMKRTGDRWAALGRTLFGDRPGPDQRAIVAALHADAVLIDRFQLHHFQEDGAEVAQLAKQYRHRLGNLDDALAHGDLDRARSAWRLIEKASCTACHVKFRWALTSDLTRLSLEGTGATPVPGTSR